MSCLIACCRVVFFIRLKQTNKQFLQRIIVCIYFSLSLSPNGRPFENTKHSILGNRDRVDHRSFFYIVVYISTLFLLFNLCIALAYSNSPLSFLSARVFNGITRTLPCCSFTLNFSFFYIRRSFLPSTHPPIHSFIQPISIKLYVA